MSTPAEPVSLREITLDTLGAILALEVAPEQQRFVAPNPVSIAQAHFSPEAWFRGIYAGDTPVGFVMLSDRPEQAEYVLWRFMIDRRHQGKGHGRAALELVIAHVKSRPGAAALYTSHVPGQGSPGPFYERMGFGYTGEADDDGELTMKLDLTA
jgi:diamine N-acetyltransferase